MRKSYEGRQPAGRRRIRPTVVLVLVVSLLAMPLAWSAQGRGKDSKQLGRHLKQGEGMAQVFQDVVGPMPGIAAAPFFGLAALSGMALLADTEYARSSDNGLVRAVCDNGMVWEAQKYSSLKLFLLLSGLALGLGSPSRLRLWPSPASASANSGLCSSRRTA